MKKIFLMVAIAVGFAMISTGCKSVSTSDGGKGIPQPVTYAPGYNAVFEHQTVRVNGEATINCLFGIFAWGAEGFAENSDLSSFSFLPSAANSAKSAAVYDACQSNSADVILGTRYVLETTDYFVFKVVNCKVAGYPAVMTDIKKLDPYVLRGKEADTIVYLDAEPKVID